jgi:hypothetical protein|tara:strand:+ start:224 stop:427 length:204 start_codon:yes stop_codon:yes gene_type:complete
VIFLNKFWLFFGIFLTFTGFGTIPGVLLIIFFIWSDLKSDIKNENDFANTVEFDPKYYNENTLKDMR